MISHIMEVIMDAALVFFARQRWYFAILYTALMLALVIASATIVLYLGSLWLFSRETASYNSLVSIVGLLAMVAMWWVLFALARNTAVKSR